MSGADPTTRFSDRVADYVRHRPGYPAELGATLARETGVGPGSIVADVGSGTGISSRVFLDLGCTVLAVEPNEEMRAAAEEINRDEPRFRSTAGRAEATTLGDASVDLAAAGQAFHWFDREAARRELRRILRPDGRVALFWNRRLTEGSPFLEAYERLLLQHGTDYERVRHDRLQDADFDAFFNGPWGRFELAHAQRLDWEGLRGRLFSSSYTPPAGHPDRGPMEEEARRIFDWHERGGRVVMEYVTELTLGRLGEEDA